jgi:hypothetical protein
LRNGICEALDNRLDELVSEVNKIETMSLEPLVESEELIQKNLRNAADIMDEGKEKQFEWNDLRCFSMHDAPDLNFLNATNVAKSYKRILDKSTGTLYRCYRLLRISNR